MHNANRMTSTELADIVAAAATDKKARDVVILDIRGKTTIADYFVICEGDTDRQVRAITENISDVCKEHGVRALAVAGLKDASWACADFDAVIAHVFLPGERTFYDLEGLWGDPAGEAAI
jgi:ribosome-associated protein